MFSIVACIGKNRELGKKGELVFHIKDDMKFFRETTTGHKIVMGRKTWESLPGKLPNRTNIVISSKDLEGPDEIIHDLDDFIESYKNSEEEIFVIGGGKIYAEFLPVTSKMYLTEVDAEDIAADTFFPDFDKNEFVQTIIKEGKENDLAFTISEYTKK
ncbi:dihydrofolate reductase [Candidatus Saccharibacteria bacterium]|nr:dihydrofolate reductase [Candidatus Saccharibacteria bacterium]